MDPFDPDRRNTVTLVRNGHAKVMFVQDIVKKAFEGEL
jgi:hypothetical protein